MRILNQADQKLYDIEKERLKFEREILDGRPSFSTAVLLHQLMWSWMFEKLSHGHWVTKPDFLEKFGFYKNNHTKDLLMRSVGRFLCFYSSQLDAGCAHCPAIFQMDDGYATGQCAYRSASTPLTEYEKFLQALEQVNIREAAKYAHQMATVKIRDKRDDDI